MGVRSICLIVASCLWVLALPAHAKVSKHGAPTGPVKTQLKTHLLDNKGHLHAIEGKKLEPRTKLHAVEDSDNHDVARFGIDPENEKHRLIARPTARAKASPFVAPKPGWLERNTERSKQSFRTQMNKINELLAHQDLADRRGLDGKHYLTSANKLLAKVRKPATFTQRYMLWVAGGRIASRNTRQGVRDYWASKRLADANALASLGAGGKHGIFEKWKAEHKWAPATIVKFFDRRGRSMDSADEGVKLASKLTERNEIRAAAMQAQKAQLGPELRNAAPSPSSTANTRASKKLAVADTVAHAGNTHFRVERALAASEKKKLDHSIKLANKLMRQGKKDLAGAILYETLKVENKPSPAAQRQRAAMIRRLGADTLESRYTAIKGEHVEIN